jgi:hypothetical protein
MLPLCQQHHQLLLVLLLTRHSKQSGRATGKETPLMLVLVLTR